MVDHDWHRFSTMAQLCSMVTHGWQLNTMMTMVNHGFSTIFQFCSMVDNETPYWPWSTMDLFLLRESLPFAPAEQYIIYVLVLQNKMVYFEFRHRSRSREHNERDRSERNRRSRSRDRKRDRSKERRRKRSRSRSPRRKDRDRNKWI